MIGHETVRMADPAEARDDVRESIEKQFAVSVREKDLLARVAPAGQMIDRAGELQTKRPCMSRFYRRLVVLQDLTPTLALTPKT
jgi:hypothetical protein